MFSKLDAIEAQYKKREEELQNPDILSQPKKYQEICKKQKETKNIVLTYQEYKDKTEELKENQDLLQKEKDPEIQQLAKEEIKDLEHTLILLEEKLKKCLLPKDPHDNKNIILEIRAGAGGNEASLFAEELLRAYSYYAQAQKWKIQLISRSEGNVGGLKEVICSISGKHVYNKLKYESGVHRVQRVPKTESQGRLHTSTVTVAVIPEAEEKEVKLEPKDIRIDVCRASGHGGQSVNTTDSAVRVLHISTGIMVYCQEGKSQHSNKERALRVLYARLLARQEEESRKEASHLRLNQIGTGDRSERIRTYNFPQTRISDHRIGFTTHALNEILQGDLNKLIEPLLSHFQSQKLLQETQHKTSNTSKAQNTKRTKEKCKLKRSLNAVLCF